METTATSSRPTTTEPLLRVQGRFYVRPTRGAFELVLLDRNGEPRSCGRVIAPNSLGLLEIRQVATTVLPISIDDFNIVADNARRKLLEAGW